MKIRTNTEGILVGAIAAMLSYLALISPATIAALAIRRKMPEAWFSALIAWFATFIVIGLSIVIGKVACRMACKDTAGAAPKSGRPG
jgi:cell division protein FtsX